MLAFLRSLIMSHKPDQCTFKHSIKTVSFNLDYSNTVVKYLDYNVTLIEQ